MLINKKLRLNILLVTGTFIIWGFIVSRIVEYYSSPKENESEVINTNEALLNVDIKKDNIDSAEQRWIQIERDPFKKNNIVSKNVVPAANISSVSKSKSKERKAQSGLPVKEKEEKANSLLLTGIITNNESKLAIIVDNATNKTLFLHTGDSYNGVIIKEIRDNSVVINEGSFSRELFVKP